MNTTGYITPVAAAVAQTTQAEAVSARQDKALATRRVPRSQNAPKDEVVLSVETADAVTADRAHDEEHDESKRQDRRRRKPAPQPQTQDELAKRRESTAQKRVAPGGRPPSGYVNDAASVPGTLDITG